MGLVGAGFVPTRQTVNYVGRTQKTQKSRAKLARFEVWFGKKVGGYGAARAVKTVDKWVAPKRVNEFACCAGVAVLTVSGEPAGGLPAAADRALYAAKRGRRDRAVLAS
jgi:GGDEF domain-containing protein